MKNIKKVIRDRIIKIEVNNLKVIEYESCNSIKCCCVVCNYEIVDNYRNLSYSQFKCEYCTLLKKSNILIDKDSEIINIKGQYLNLKCRSGHIYKQDKRNLLAGKKCYKCYIESKKITQSEVLSKFLKIHGDSYSYNMSNYKNLHSKVEITCNKGHVFIQKVSNHIQGKGCPVCRESFGERIISKYLDDNNIIYVKQKKFKDCKYINQLPFDFYLPTINILIEYDGIQHFEPVGQFGGEEEFQKTIMKDSIKNRYCLDNKINLIRISYQDNIYLILQCIKENIIL